MTEQQLDALRDWVKAMIDAKIENAFGRDAMHEEIALINAADNLLAAFGGEK